jgi:hypothetical protein
MTLARDAVAVVPVVLLAVFGVSVLICISAWGPR